MSLQLRHEDLHKADYETLKQTNIPQDGLFSL